MKLFRAVVLVTGVSAGSSSEGIRCSINAARAVDEMLDTAMWTWTSVERCKTVGTAGDKGLQCEMDIARAAESVNGMVNVIVHALEDCGQIQGDKCGMAAGKLTQSAAGMAAAAGGIWKKCAKGQGLVNPNASPVAQPRPLDKWAFCLVNVKDSLRSLMKAVQRAQSAEHACKDKSKDCGAVITGVISAFAAIGQYATSAVGDCSPTVLPQQVELECSSQVAMAVRHTTQFATDATELSDDCGKSASRLYALDLEQEKELDTKKNGSPVATASFVLLPIVAFVSFVSGRKLGTQRVPASAHEFAPLNLVDTEA